IGHGLRLGEHDFRANPPDERTQRYCHRHRLSDAARHNPTAQHRIACSKCKGRSQGQATANEHDLDFAYLSEALIAQIISSSTAPLVGKEATPMAVRE